MAIQFPYRSVQLFGSSASKDVRNRKFSGYSEWKSSMSEWDFCVLMDSMLIELSLIN